MPMQRADHFDSVWMKLQGRNQMLKEPAYHAPLLRNRKSYAPCLHHHDNEKVRSTNDIFQAVNQRDCNQHHCPFILQQNDFFSPTGQHVNAAPGVLTPIIPVPS